MLTCKVLRLIAVITAPIKREQSSIAAFQSFWRAFGKLDELHRLYQNCLMRDDWDGSAVSRWSERLAKKSDTSSYS